MIRSVPPGEMPRCDENTRTCSSYPSPRESIHPTILHFTSLPALLSNFQRSICSFVRVARPAASPKMTFILPRGPKMIEAICPGCFKSFTKIGSMHRVSTPSTQISHPMLMSMKHIYEDRCRNPVPRFVKKIKAEHNARVAAAAARSAARAAARAAPAAAAPPPPEQNTNTQVKIEGQEPTKHCLPSLDCGCGVTFSHKTDLDLVRLAIHQLV